MTVKELREAIKDLPEDMLVAQSRDPEGNGFNLTSELGFSMAEVSEYGVDVIHPDDMEHRLDLLDGDRSSFPTIAILWP